MINSNTQGCVGSGAKKNEEEPEFDFIREEFGFRWQVQESLNHFDVRLFADEAIRDSALILNSGVQFNGSIFQKKTLGDVLIVCKIFSQCFPGQVAFDISKLKSTACQVEDISDLAAFVGGVSNAMDRVHQFSMQTLDGRLAQKCWEVCSEIIKQVISKSILSSSSDEFFQQPVFTYRNGKAIIERKVSYPLLFVALGLARYSIETPLNSIRKKKETDFDFEELTASYAQMLGEKVHMHSISPFGRFRTKHEHLQEVIQSDLRAGFPSTFEGLKKERAALHARLSSFEHRYEVDITRSLSVEVFSISSNMPLTESDLDYIKYFIKDSIIVYPLIFIDCQPSGDKYLINVKSLDQSCSLIYHKYYLSRSENIEGRRNFGLGGIRFDVEQIVCYHHADFFLMWDFLKEKFDDVCQAIKSNASSRECLQKIGEFLFLYINIMPYKRGSAAIGEWLMKSMAEARGIELGRFRGNEEMLSWDFSAFFQISGHEYGKNFEKFFTSVEYCEDRVSKSSAKAVPMPPLPSPKVTSSSSCC